MTRLASPRRWWGRSESDEVDRPTDTTNDQAAEPAASRDASWAAEHNAKIDQATEQAAVAIRDAAARAAADRAHARARTSTMAGIALVLSVVAALAVASGALAAVGVGVGIVAILFAVGGLSATGRRYSFLAGRGQAVIAMLVAVCAVVVGVLAVSGQLAGFDTDTNTVDRLRDLLPGWLS